MVPVIVARRRKKRQAEEEGAGASKMPAPGAPGGLTGLAALRGAEITGEGVTPPPEAG